MNRSPSQAESAQVGVLDAGSGLHFEPDDAAVPGLQYKINLVPVLRPEVRGSGYFFGPAHLLEDLRDGERLDEMPELVRALVVRRCKIMGKPPARIRSTYSSLVTGRDGISGTLAGSAQSQSTFWATY